MKLWIVGRGYPSWEFMGVFDSEEKAVEACTAEADWIAPTTLNEREPEERMEWPGLRYPVPLTE